MSASPQPAFRDLSQQPEPRKKARGQVCAFTRHPTAVATALGRLQQMNLRASLHLLMEALVMRVDREGLYWGRVGSKARKGELEELTGLSFNTLRVLLREAKKLELLKWRKVKPFGRYPKRDKYSLPVKLAQGRRTAHGGRVFVLQWEKFGVAFTSRDLGMEVARWISTDLPGLIGTDLPSDPLGSPSEILNRDPAPAPRAPRAAPPPDRAGVARRARNPESETAPPPAANMASETSCAATVALALPPRLARNGRDREHGRGGLAEVERDPEVRRLKVEAMRAELAQAMATDRPRRR